MIKLVIFDLDGTLIDSAPDIVATTNQLLISRGRPTLPEKTIVQAIGEGLKPLISSCFPEAKNNPAELDAIDRDFYAAYRQNLVVKTTVFPGVVDFLEKTERQFAIVTNKYIDLTEQTLQSLGLDLHPWVRVYGSDSLPEKKPHPLPLQEVMKAAGAKPEQTVMVGDGLPDMGAARRAGVQAIACGYGYCAAEKLIQAGASHVIQSPFELESLLNQINRF